MAPTETINIQLSQGTISAIRKDDIVSARGVKYATAKRFKPPQPSPAWSGTIDCTKPAPICPQSVPSRLDGTTGPLARGRVQDEDCLHVTVTTLAQFIETRSRAPVMAFFHGGAYVSGGADLDCYEPSKLVRKGVVVVNISHRLGLLGYQSIPEVAPANLGLLDQIQALRWIQDNIESFGGDNNTVTLFGESAGADSIFCLMIADNTEGLFHRAIMQSPPMGRFSLDREQMTTTLSGIASQWLTDNTQPNTNEELLSLQTKLLIAAQQYPSRIMAFGPSLGHAPLPNLSDVPNRIRLVAPKIPLLMGCTKDEGRPFTRLLGSAQLFDLPLIGRYLELFYAWLIGSRTFRWPTQRFHQQYLQAGGQSSLYKFNWKPLHSSLGASHCIDLPFILGSWESWKAAPMLGGTNSRVDVEIIGDEVKTLWAAFASGVARPLQTFSVAKGFTAANNMIQEDELVANR